MHIELSQITALVRLRSYQIKKIFYELNNYAIFIAILALILIWFSYLIHRDDTSSTKMFVACALIILLIHLQRKDRSFVFTHIQNGRWAMRLEYFVFVFPLLVFSLAFNRWTEWICLLTWIMIVPYVHTSSQNRTYLSVIQWIPSMYFEWKSGWRRNFLLCMSIYILAWSFSWFKILPLFLLWFLTTIVMTFYDDNEGLEIINESPKNASSFLFLKLKNHLALVSILYGPILLINTICNIEYVWIILLFFVAQCVLVAFAIINKYQYYTPNIKIVSNSHFTTIITLLAALPGFFIIPLALLFYQLPKAIAQIKLYTDHD